MSTKELELELKLLNLDLEELNFMKDENGERVLARKNMKGQSKDLVLFQ